MTQLIAVCITKGALYSYSSIVLAIQLSLQFWLYSYRYSSGYIIQSSELPEYASALVYGLYGKSFMRILPFISDAQSTRIHFSAFMSIKYTCFYTCTFQGIFINNIHNFLLQHPCYYEVRTTSKSMISIIMKAVYKITYSFQ